MAASAGIREAKAVGCGSASWRAGDPLRRCRESGSHSYPIPRTICLANGVAAAAVAAGGNRSLGASEPSAGNQLHRQAVS